MRTHRANTSRITVCVFDTETVVDNIQRVYRVRVAAKVERHVEHLPTGNRPPFVFAVVDGTLNPAINRIGNVSRYLTEGETRIKYNDELTVRGLGDDRVVLNDLAVGSDDPFVFIC